MKHPAPFIDRCLSPACCLLAIGLTLPGLAQDQDAALWFDGINDYVQVASAAALNLSKQITIEAWVWPTGLTGCVISKADYWHSVGNYNLWLVDGKPRFSYFDGTGYNSYYNTTGVSLVSGQWQHVAVTYDFSTFAIAVYVDGVPTSGSWETGSGADPPDRPGAAVNNDPLLFGAVLTVTDGHGLPPGSPLSLFAGVIDEVRIWSVIRSATDIAASRPGQLTGRETGIVGCWRFHQGEGLVASDESPNGLHGSLGGGSPSRVPQWLPALSTPSLANCRECGTAVGGLLGNATWTKAGSPYCVTNDILALGRLSIEPGVEVRFCGNYEFQVQGRLLVNGTEEEQVRFRPADASVGWQGLVFPNTQPGSSLVHAIIEGSRHGGLRLTNCAPSLTHCQIINNWSPEGGGGIKAMIGNAADWVIQDCVISNNVASGYGGGIRLNTDRRFLADSCLIVGNEGMRLGGGFCTTTGTNAILRFERCVSINNRVGPLGGGSGVGGGGFLFAGPEDVWRGHYVAELTGCVISNNAAVGWPGSWVNGGGVNQNGGATVLRNCWIADNIVTNSGVGSGAVGGGISLSASESCTIENCLIARNSLLGAATLRGAGIHQDGGNLKVSNATVVANPNAPGVTMTSSSGAGPSSAALTNCIVYFNNNGGVQMTGNVSAQYCCLQGGWAGDGNISFAPGLCPDTYSLAPASPCIDAGHPGLEYRDGCVDNTVDCSRIARGTPRNDVGAFGGPRVCCWTDPCDRPVIRIQPDNVVALEGDTVAIGVVATGGSPMIYQWYKGGHYIEGATNAVLRIPALTAADSSFALVDGGGAPVLVTNTYWAFVDNDWNQRLHTEEVWLLVTRLGVRASIEGGKLWLTIRRNDPAVTKCMILSATGPMELPFDLVEYLDLNTDVTHHEVRQAPAERTRFYRVEVVR